jgi:hypothetical protein
MPYCSASCPADDLIECLGPGDCGGSTPGCLATDVLNGVEADAAGFPNCVSTSLSTQCVPANKAVSAITVSCTATEYLHVCEAAGDCAADTSNPNCCLVSNYHVCVSNLFKTVGSLSCL